MLNEFSHQIFQVDFSPNNCVIIIKSKNFTRLKSRKHQMRANNNNVLLNLETFKHRKQIKRLKYTRILCKVKERKHLTFSNVLPDCFKCHRKLPFFGRKIDLGGIDSYVIHVVFNISFLY